MEKLKTDNPFMQTSEQIKPLPVLFMGGKVVITPGGSFTVDNKQVEYPAKVKLGSMVDGKGNIDPASFLAMVQAVNNNENAIILLEKLK